MIPSQQLFEKIHALNTQTHDTPEIKRRFHEVAKSGTTLKSSLTMDEADYIMMLRGGDDPSAGATGLEAVIKDSKHWDVSKGNQDKRLEAFNKDIKESLDIAATGKTDALKKMKAYAKHINEIITEDAQKITIANLKTIQDCTTAFEDVTKRFEPIADIFTQIQKLQEITTLLKSKQQDQYNKITDAMIRDAGLKDSDQVTIDIKNLRSPSSS